VEIPLIVANFAVAGRYILAGNQGESESFTLNLQVKCSSETLVLTKATRHHIPEDGILHSHRRENLKPYIPLTGWTL
jgi:hypothetical protein